jgi:hypothetical protein
VSAISMANLSQDILEAGILEKDQIAYPKEKITNY